MSANLTPNPMPHQELTTGECRNRALGFMNAVDALQGVVPFCSSTAQNFWQERVRDLQASQEYWTARARDTGRRLVR